MSSHRLRATSLEMPFATQPSRNFVSSDAISERIFLPIALRRSSASAGEKPPRSLAICIDCSWYTVMPIVEPRIGSSLGCRYVVSSCPFLRRAYIGMFCIGPGRYSATSATRSSKQVGLTARKRVAHARRLELEDPERVGAREHLVGARVVERQVGQVAEVDVGRFADDADGLVDHVEVAQAEEVHLEEAERLDVAHRELRDDGLARTLLLQRQVLHQRAVADHDAGRVDRVGPRQPLERPRDLDDLAGGLVLVAGLRELLPRLEAIGEVDLRALGDQLRDAVDDAVRHTHHAPGVAHGGLAPAASRT